MTKQIVECAALLPKLLSGELRVPVKLTEAVA
jgi:hypothetical protein